MYLTGSASKLLLVMFVWTCHLTLNSTNVFALAISVLRLMSYLYYFFLVIIFNKCSLILLNLIVLLCRSKYSPMRTKYGPIQQKHPYTIHITKIVILCRTVGHSHKILNTQNIVFTKSTYLYNFWRIAISLTSDLINLSSCFERTSQVFY